MKETRECHSPIIELNNEISNTSDGRGQKPVPLRLIS